MAEPQRLSWVDSPARRGTLNILWSCFVTLSLCVWTAVHPNIQWQLPRWQIILGQRLWMMITAIVFPEILISAAWRQREEVASLKENLAGRSDLCLAGAQLKPQTLSNHLTEHFRSSNQSSTFALSTKEMESKSKTDSGSWKDKKLFFAVMGGFIVEQTYTGGDGKSHKLRYIVNPEGIELLALAGVSFNIDIDEIDERDNADYIAKLIVLGQVLWFAIQIIARLSQALPVTPLEIHTVVHVGCAILMYAIWWHKPYNLTRAVVLSDKVSEAVGALMICNEVVKRLRDKESQAHEKEVKAYWHKLAVDSNNEDSDFNLTEPLEPRVFRLKDVLDEILQSNDTPAWLSSKTDDSYILSSLADNARKGLAKLEAEFRSIGPTIEAMSCIRQKTNNFAIREVWGAWSSDIGHELNSEKILHFGFNLLYGGAHIAAWNSNSFPTTIEQWLWRYSAIFIASVWLWGMIWLLYWRASRSPSRWCSPFRNGDLDIIFGPFFCFVVIAFVLARCYLFAEALASLRYLPDGAFDNVSWTNFLPHSS